jgi:energy-coupling factor transporter ATP-binding protein EcfA2
MISIILGHKGSGKTKSLISCVNKAIETSKGNVVCVEKETKLTYDVNYRARLIGTDDYEIRAMLHSMASLPAFAQVTTTSQMFLLTLLSVSAAEIITSSLPSLRRFMSLHQLTKRTSSSQSQLIRMSFPFQSLTSVRFFNIKKLLKPTVSR